MTLRRVHREYNCAIAIKTIKDRGGVSLVSTKRNYNLMQFNRNFRELLHLL